jgi:LCP family protein required for cell wall assembly
MKKKVKSGMTGGQKLVIVLVVLVLVLGMIAGTLIWLYRPPVDPDLPFETDPPHVTRSPDDPVPSTTDPQNAEYTPRNDVYNFLLIGHDRVGTLADVIMLVNYDIGAGALTVMQLPRDTYFEGDSSVSQLNVQFSAYYNRATLSGDGTPARTAASLFARQLEQNLCIKIHYTAVLNLDGFVKIVDAIGGVDIDIPADMDYDDPEQGLSIHLKAGPHHLNGEQAEGFVRFRSGYEQVDIGRVDAQKLFMSAFLQKVKSTVSITNVTLLTKLVNEAAENLTTDLPVADMIYFARNALGLDLSAVRMMTIPCDYAGGLVINRAATLAAVNSYFNIYNNDITDTIFDRNLRFVNEDSALMYAAYTADAAVIVSDHTAQEIEDNSIYIPRKDNP